MRRPKLKPAEAARIRDEWLGQVNSLTQQVRGWAERQGWTVTQSEREVIEEQLGSYKVPVLEIDTPRGQVVLEPIGQDVLGAKGRVDLYAWPTHYRVMLLRTGGPDWVIRTDSGLNWPQPWEPTTFVTLAEGLLGAE
jgi:hypothetical protein